MDIERKTSKFSIKTLRLVVTFSIALLAFGTFTIGFSSQLATAQAQLNNSTTAAAKPIDGYGGPPTGPLTAIRHVFDDPTLRVYHFCKPNDKIIMVCQLYDGNSPNSTLIEVEYMIDSKTYKALPDREKPNWHYHKEEFAPARADPIFPQLSEQQQKEWFKKLEESYGKVVITWNPNDRLPAFPPQIEQVQHPFMVNQTVTHAIETHAGSFNQTLNY